MRKPYRRESGQAAAFSRHIPHNQTVSQHPHGTEPRARGQDRFPSVLTPDQLIFRVCPGAVISPQPSRLKAVRAVQSIIDCVPYLHHRRSIPGNQLCLLRLFPGAAAQQQTQRRDQAAAFLGRRLTPHSRTFPGRRPRRSGRFFPCRPPSAPPGRTARRCPQPPPSPGPGD